jgi:hypothetical protein
MRKQATKTALPGDPGRKVIRFTYLMSPVMERNLAIYAFKSGVSKQHSITLALEKLLRDAGLDPTRVPTVSISYDEKA